MSQDEKRVNLIYVLWSVSFFIPAIGIVGMLMGLMHRRSTEGTWLATQHTWLLHTGVVYIVGSVIGWLTFSSVLGAVILLGLNLWLLGRVLRGWEAFYNKETLPAEWL